MKNAAVSALEADGFVRINSAVVKGQEAPEISRDQAEAGSHGKGQVAISATSRRAA